MRWRTTPLLWLLAAFFAVTTLSGAITHYTPVPLHDMWNGYVDFNMRVDDGDLKAWWEPHNEHRIVLSRVLFWIDMHLFGGNVAFLILTNLILLAAILISVLWLFSRVVPKSVFVQLAPLVICWLLFWSQRENITWGFQSQFFMAYLFPLLAFILFARFVECGSHKLLALALLFGITSALSMANGVLVLPLLVFFALRARASWFVVSGFLIAACLVNGIYFYDYQAPAGHGSLLETLNSQPGNFFNYIFNYLGSPIKHALFFVPSFGGWLATIAGLVFVVLAVLLSFRAVFANQPSPVALGLVCFIVYLGATAAGTAGGRTLFGVSQAFSPRYTTPALIGWVVLVALFLQYYSVARIGRAGFFILVGFVLILIPFQATALSTAYQHERHAQYAAVTALAWQVQDESQIAHVFPFTDWVLSMANKASARQFSVFRSSELVSVNHQEVATLAPNSSSLTNSCTGYIDTIVPVPARQQSYKVTGWLGNSSPQLFNSVYDDAGKVVGSVATGGVRPDVAERIDASFYLSGFTGYFQSQGSKKLYIVDPVLNCHLKAVLPKIPFSMNAFGQEEKMVVLGSVVSSTLTGGDYYRTEFEGYRVLGSYKSSDADQGEVRIRVGKGGSIRFITGPSVSGLTLSVDDSVYAMPSSINWTELVFDDTSLPSEFDVVLSDKGTGWGSWFALALRDQ